jgi:hypothetical protein
MTSTPASTYDLAAELEDLRIRFRQIPAYEASVIAAEVHLISRDPEQAELIEGLSPAEFEALAIMRLIERKVLTTLYNQEARLWRRADRLQKLLLEAEQRSQETAAAPQPQSDHRPEENCKNEPNSAPPLPASSNKIGRNEPCPCGSTLKFKRCCGNPLGVQPRTTAAAA